MAGARQATRLGEVVIERMTWPDVEAALAAGARTVVIPVGATEQHGHHLPEGSDAFMGEAVGERVALALGDALVAPVIRPGCSDHHMEFPGTLSITPELLMALLDAYVSSLARHGFARFVVFSTHGGNFAVLARWAAERSDPRVICIPDRTGHVRPEFAFAVASGTEAPGQLHHSDAYETSQILALQPQLVHMDRAQRGYVGKLTMAELEQRGTRAVSPNGVLGDPAGASAEVGTIMLESVTGYVVEQVRAALETRSAERA